MFFNRAQLANFTISGHFYFYRFFSIFKFRFFLNLTEIYKPVNCAINYLFLWTFIIAIDQIIFLLNISRNKNVSKKISEKRCFLQSIFRIITISQEIDIIQEQIVWLENKFCLYAELLTRRTIAHNVCSQMVAIVIEIKIAKKKKKQWEKGKIATAGARRRLKVERVRARSASIAKI